MSFDPAIAALCIMSKGKELWMYSDAVSTFQTDDL